MLTQLHRMPITAIPTTAEPFADLKRCAASICVEGSILAARVLDGLRDWCLYVSLIILVGVLSH